MVKFVVKFILDKAKKKRILRDQYEGLGYKAKYYENL